MNESPMVEPSAFGEPVIRTQDLTRYFGRKAAVDGVSVVVPRGSVFAFLGRNGSGKTTAIRMILGLLPPTRGTASIFGRDSATLAADIRRRIGYIAENHPVYPWMTVRQMAAFQRGTYGRWNSEIFNAILDYFNIELRSFAGRHSRGQRAGLCLALTLAVEPDLLILDDPALGLDPVARRALLEAMLYFTRGGDRTILFSSHLLDDVERVADHVAVMDNSVLRACCSVETFRQSVRQFVLMFAGAPPRSLPAVPGLLQVGRDDNQIALVIVNPDEGTEQVLASLGAKSIEPHPLSLQDAALAYVGRRGDKGFLLKTLGGGA